MNIVKITITTFTSGYKEINHIAMNGKSQYF